MFLISGWMTSAHHTYIYYTVSNSDGNLTLLTLIILIIIPPPMTTTTQCQWLNARAPPAQVADVDTTMYFKWTIWASIQLHEKAQGAQVATGDNHHLCKWHACTSWTRGKQAQERQELKTHWLPHIGPRVPLAMVSVSLTWSGWRNIPWLWSFVITNPLHWVMCIYKSPSAQGAKVRMQGAKVRMQGAKVRTQGAKVRASISTI